MTSIGLADKVERVDRALARARIPHAFGGSLALAYYTVPRATVDIDVNVFVPTENHRRVVSALRRAGVDKVPDEVLALRDGQIRMWWATTPVDVFYAYDPIHVAMRDAARKVPFGTTTIPILAPEHLLVAKAVFDRAKDWIDIEQMLVAVDHLDLSEIRRWMHHLVGEDDARFAHLEILIGRTRD